ncbi:MAG: carboxylating nicotinate-nucleotide diphosphorylase [Candidatus Sumerlaeia bacterium]|nr:carboxylating nicotinate-nucleotide diphosphorylase [Candidatus Sumerlaeia bacterium]
MAVPAFAPLKITADLRRRIAAALAEDIGTGDVTTQAVVGARERGRAVILARERGIVCGLPVVAEVFMAADRRLRVRCLRQEGDAVDEGDEVFEVAGSLGAILKAERVALNFLQRLSGIATLTRRYVEALSGSKTRVFDTRKTTPLWRDLEKYAVRVGGGCNHRFGLYDMVLIKNNHADAAGSLAEAIRRVRCGLRDKRRRLRVMAEVRNLREVREAVAGGVDMIMFDNLTPTQMRQALREIPSGVQTEASGGMTVRRVRALAQLGLDRISVGALTHSAPAIDFSLRYRKA